MTCAMMMAARFAVCLLIVVLSMAVHDLITQKQDD